MRYNYANFVCLCCVLESLGCDSSRDRAKRSNEQTHRYAVVSLCTMMLIRVGVFGQLRTLSGLEYRENHHRDTSSDELRQCSVKIEDAQVNTSKLAGGRLFGSIDVPSLRSHLD